MHSEAQQQATEVMLTSGGGACVQSPQFTVDSGQYDPGVRTVSCRLSTERSRQRRFAPAVCDQSEWENEY